MKLFSEATKKLTQEQLQELSSHFNLKKINPAALKTAMLSPAGIESLLRTLNQDELRVVKTVYEHDDGINYGEIDKELKLGIHNIERITKTLTQKLLIYTIKNRQLLSNKMDKVYGLEEIAPFIKIENVTTIRDNLKSNIDWVLAQNKETRNVFTTSDKMKKLVSSIAVIGGIIPIEDAIKKAGEKNFNTLIPELQSKNNIWLYQIIEPEYTSYAVLDRQMFQAALDETEKTPGPGIQNGYTAILNLFYAFDTISTYGLFLTKQNEFRKIDKRRIMDAMAWLTTCKGEHFSLEKTAELSLFLLNQLQCLTVNKDIITVSLRNIKKDIDNPKKIMYRLVRSLENPADENSIFPSPIDIPDPSILQNIMKILHERPATTRAAIHSLSLAMAYSQSKKRSLKECLKQKDRLCREIENALLLLTIIGFIDFRDGMYCISEAGSETLQQIYKSPQQARQEKSQKCLYINPDFTILIPTQELPSVSLFHLLSHAEIIKQDVLLHARVSKASIVKAQKRGMNLRHFLDALEKHSKNQIPQNLNFLLNEWSTQTIKINISLSILLKSNHPSFIDELYLGKIKDAIIERVSDRYVIISKKYIDDVIKIAQKKDAVISLFMDTDEDTDD